MKKGKKATVKLGLSLLMLSGVLSLSSPICASSRNVHTDKQYYEKSLQKAKRSKVNKQREKRIEMNYYRLMTKNLLKKKK